jgi:hypothetical protein
MQATELRTLRTASDAIEPRVGAWRSRPRRSTVHPTVMAESEATARSISLDEFAAMSAAIDAGVPSGQVLAEAKLSTEAWESAKERWLVELAGQAALGRLAPSRRCVEIVGAEWPRVSARAKRARKKAAGEVPAVPVAVASPLAGLDGELVISSMADRGRGAAPRPIAVALPVAPPPPADARHGTGTGPMAPIVRVESALPFQRTGNAGADARAAPARDALRPPHTTLPFVQPGQPPKPSPTRPATDPLQPSPFRPALPFVAPTLPIPLTTAPLFQEPEGETVDEVIPATDPLQPSPFRPALPFVAPTLPIPLTTAPLFQEPEGETVDEAIPATDPLQPSPFRPALPFVAPTPSIPLTSAPLFQEPEGETVDEAIPATDPLQPTPLRPALPFVELSPSAEPPRAPASRLDDALLFQRPLAPAAPAAPQQPAAAPPRQPPAPPVPLRSVPSAPAFRPIAAPASADSAAEAMDRARKMKLRDYANLCAGVRAFPDHVAWLKARYGLDAASWTLLHILWRARFEHDGKVKAEWERLVAQSLPYWTQRRPG